VRNELLFRFLLSRPFRSANIRAMRLGQHVFKRDGRWHIRFSASEVKNKAAIECTFPEDLVLLLETYLREHRPVLARRTDTDLLFPTREGTAMSQTGLLKMVQDACDRHIGKHMRVHWFRHCAAIFMLTAEPGSYLLVSKLLGHKSLGTTLRYYGRVNEADAIRRLDAWRQERLGPNRNRGRS